MGAMFTIKNGWFMTLLYPHYKISLELTEVIAVPRRSPVSMISVMYQVQHLPLG